MKSVILEFSVAAGTDRPSPSGEGGLFAGNSPLVDTNDR
jgi:hypothetical protein